MKERIVKITLWLKPYEDFATVGPNDPRDALIEEKVHEKASNIS